MKHLFLLLILAVGIYTAWVMADKPARKRAVRHITRHGLQIGAIVLVLFLLVWVAAQLPASSLI